MRLALGLVDLVPHFVNQTTHGRSLLATWSRARTSRAVVGLDWRFILLEATLEDVPRTLVVYVWVFEFPRNTV